MKYRINVITESPIHHGREIEHTIEAENSVIAVTIMLTEKLFLSEGEVLHSIHIGAGHG